MTTPRPDLVNLPQLTTPSEANTLIVVQDSAVNQYLTVPQARALLSLTVGYTGSRGQVGFIGSTGYTGSFGLTGFTGSTGTQGVTGFTGSTGTAATVAVGLVTVSTSTASVTNVGTPYAAIFNFVLQRGPIGFTGSTGTQGVTGFTGSTGTQGDIGFTGSRGLTLTTATDLAGGTVGSIPIQVATSQTGFIPIGSEGQLLRVVGGTAAWASTASLKVGFSVYSDLGYVTQLTTSTIGTRWLTMGNNLNSYANLGATLDLSYTPDTRILTAGNLELSGRTASTSTSNGTLVVDGGVGISGDVYIGGLLSVQGVGTATNIANGTAGQVPYQTAPGVTSFYGPGTAGNVLVSNGTSAPTYNNTLTLAGTTTATSTQSGALVVAGGVGIGGDLYIGGEIVANKLTIQLTTVTTTLVTTDDIIRTYNSTNATSTTTGALQVTGGAGIGGDLYVGGNIYPLGIIGTVSTATNIAGGTIGGVLFQRAVGSTTATTSGNDGNIFISRGPNAIGPTFVNTNTFVVGFANTALNVASAGSSNDILGGTVNQLLYQIATNDTGFTGPGTAGQLLISNGLAAGGPTFVNTNTFVVGFANTALNVASATSSSFAGTATDVAGGIAGQILYQISPGDTGFAGPGTAGNVLVSNGSNAPTYNNTLTLTSTLASTSSVTANALYVAGGVGIGRTLYVIGDIYSAGEITAYYSDDRLKNRLEDITDALDKVKSLSGFYYTPNETALKFGYKDKRQVGVSAQATQKVLPEIVTTAPVSADYLTVQYEKFIPLLIEAIKELSAEVDDLKKKIQ
jgi:collagen type VII alpha